MVIDFKAIRTAKANKSKILYALTHVNRDGLRQLTLPNQGRNHYGSEWAAQQALNLLEPTLRAILGDLADTLEVRPVECYSHGDAKGIYFD